jgi:hypothetical protein
MSSSTELLRRPYTCFLLGGRVVSTGPRENLATTQIRKHSSCIMVRKCINVYIILITFHSLRLLTIQNFYSESTKTARSVKSPTLNKRRPEDMFISGGSPHFTSRFCRVELGPTQILRWYQSLLQDLLGRLLSDFGWVIHHLYLHLKPNSARRESVCRFVKKSHIGWVRSDYMFIK